MQILLYMALVFVPNQDPEVFQPRFRPEAPRSAFWSPLGSLAVPGLGQMLKGQWAYGLSYAGLGVTGLGLLASGSGSQFDGFTDRSGDARRALIGSSLYSLAGGMSAYQDFRTAVATRRSSGEYAFLDPEKAETPFDIALAPFRFDYLARWTTLLPLAVLGTGFAIYAKVGKENWHGIKAGDIPVVSTISYSAGVGEEGTFRGWLLPFFHEHMHNLWWSNLSQATIFAALHIQEGNWVPWPQFILGAYLGWLVDYRDWQISEGIFIHAWWDVIALGAEFATTGRIEEIRTPTLQIHF